MAQITRGFLTLLVGSTPLARCQRCQAIIRLGDQWIMDIHHESTGTRYTTLCAGCAAELIACYERVTEER